MVPVTGKVQLHLRRLWCGNKGAGEPVLMLHGAAEDGKAQEMEYLIRTIPARIRMEGFIYTDQ